MNRRAQKPITIRSDRAAARLALLTRNGRSQAAVIEEALDRMPLPREAEGVAERIAALRAAAARYAAGPRRGRTLAEFEAEEYDERGNPR